MENSKNKRSRKGTPKKRSKDYRNSSDRERKESFDKGNQYKDDPKNLFEWYNRNPLLTQAAASIPFPYRPGMTLDLGAAIGTKDFAEVGTSLQYEIPGVMALTFQPTVGYCSQVTDPISLAAKEMYGRVRAAFSGSLPEDAPDIMLYVLAMDSIFMAISNMKRVYRIISTFSPDNYDIPDVLLKALTNASAVATLPQYKMQLFQYINELVGMTRKLYVPAIFDILNRHYWMCDNVYTDDSTANSQMYVFKLGYAYKFQLDSEGKGMLEPISMSWQNGSYTNVVDNMYYTVRGMIEALSNSEDAYTISGHLMRAYDGIAPFVVEPITLNEPFVPYYVPEVLMQIENCKPVVLNAGSTRITQVPSTNALKSNPQVASASKNGTFENITWSTRYYFMKNLLSIRSDVPTIEMIVEASRLNPALILNTQQIQVHCGSEVVTGLSLYTNSTTVDVDPNYGMGNSSEFALLEKMALLEAWDWHPILMFSASADGVATPRTRICGDIHNATVIDGPQMQNINKVCLLSEFNAFALQ